MIQTVAIKELSYLDKFPFRKQYFLYQIFKCVQNWTKPIKDVKINTFIRILFVTKFTGEIYQRCFGKNKVNKGLTKVKKKFAYQTM